jgi:hypothetical protein
MHHPPFSSGFHRVEWENDKILRERRERMVRTLHETGIGVLASGHEHAYQRALLTWPDAVLVILITGGAGSPLHAIPSPEESAEMFSEYRVGGGVILPENVFTSINYHFVHVRLWFGGGELCTFAVAKDSSVMLIDRVEIDLKRHGIPAIDQFKRVIPAEGPKAPPPADESKGAAATAAKSDSLSAGEKLKTEPAPGDQP